MKRPSFQDLKGAPAPTTTPAPAPAPTERPRKFVSTRDPQTRRGVTFFLPTDAQRQLRLLSVKEDRSVQDLMVEATAMLFSDRGVTRTSES